ncbi:MAG: hypothetical protein ABW128_15120 [Rhizorhabdus sp.]
MVKDPNYDRYAGIVSLPGSDGKTPRPFRVDEDGNVVYQDGPCGIDRILNAAKRNSAGILSWDELDRRAEASSAPSVMPAMFVNLSDEAESKNWEVRDREGRIINRPRKPQTDSGSGRRSGSGSGKGGGKPLPKSPPKPKGNG